MQVVQVNLSSTTDINDLVALLSMVVFHHYSLDWYRIPPMLETAFPKMAETPSKVAFSQVASGIVHTMNV